MKCDHPDCTGVHDNNRYWELCPRSLDLKREKDERYHASVKGALKRLPFELRTAETIQQFEDIERWVEERCAAGNVPTVDEIISHVFNNSLL